MRRLKQGQLAKIIGIRQETLSRMERGSDAVPGYVRMILMLIERGGEEALQFARREVGLIPEREKENVE
jgi:DNA-binding transcriptional regulator YiaG